MTDEFRTRVWVAAVLAQSGLSIEALLRHLAGDADVAQRRTVRKWIAWMRGDQIMTWSYRGQSMPAIVEASGVAPGCIHWYMHPLWHVFYLLERELLHPERANWDEVIIAIKVWLRSPAQKDAAAQAPGGAVLPELLGDLFNPYDNSLRRRLSNFRKRVELMNMIVDELETGPTAIVALEAGRYLIEMLFECACASRIRVVLRSRNLEPTRRLVRSVLAHRRQRWTRRLWAIDGE